MTKLTTKTLIITLTSISLWIIGSYLLFNEKNGKATITIFAVILIAGLYSQIRKRSNSEIKKLSYRTLV